MSDPIAISRALSPASYSRSLPALSSSTLRAELLRLSNSHAHLVSTNATLLEPEWRDQEFARDAVRENEGVIERVSGRMEVLVYEMRRRGLDAMRSGTDADSTMKTDAEMKVGEEGDAVCGTSGTTGECGENGGGQGGGPVEGIEL